MSKTKKNNRKLPKSITGSKIWPKVVSLSIIGVCFILVIISIIASFIYSPENVVHSSVESLAKDYYENYIYSEIENSDNPDSTPEKALSSYQKHGLTPVKLRQILLHHEKQNAKILTFIENYCDINQTNIRYYPDPPYGKTDYHVSYVYSCNF